MKVKELIEELKTCNPEAEAVITDSYDQTMTVIGAGWVTELSVVEILYDGFDAEF